MSAQDGPSLDDLNAISNLQRQEAFDDTTEALHKTMSKRGQLVSSSASRSSAGSASEEKKLNAEEQLLSIIMSQSTKRSPQLPHSKERTRSTSRSRRSAPRSLNIDDSDRRARSLSRSKRNTRSLCGEGESPDSKQPQKSDRRDDFRKTPSTSRFHKSTEHDSEPRETGKTRSTSRRDQFSKAKSVSTFDSSSSRRSNGHSRERRSRKDHLRNSRMEAMAQEEPNEDKMERDEVTNSERNNAPNRREAFRKANSAGDLGHSSSKDDPQRRRSSRRSGTSTELPPMRKSRNSRSGDEPQRRSSRTSKMHHRSINDGETGNECTGEFEGGWGGNSKTSLTASTLFDRSTTRIQSRVSSVSMDGNNSVGTKDTVSTHSRHGENEGTPSPKQKKTKLEKIYELQDKCSRYKKEWLNSTKDKKRLRDELQEKNSEVLRLRKEVDIHKSETTILQTHLSESLQKLDELQEEQEKGRAESSANAKDLVEIRSEHTKVLNDVCELRQQLDTMEETLKTKDLQIFALEEDLKRSKIQAEELDSDLHFAEETVLTMEEDMKAIKQELAEYREAAEAGGDGNSEEMTKVRDEIEKRLLEDRERRLEEKQQKLEEKMKQIEEERERLLEKEKEREAEFAKHLDEEHEKKISREEERTRLDEDFAERISVLEADKAALQGRLKSEQLNSEAKLRHKEERLETLQKELDAVQAQLEEMGNDPEGVASLKRELEAAHSETSNLKEELEDVQKHNKMLKEEIDELQSGAKTLEGEISALTAEVAAQKRETDLWQRKSSEWEAKSGEWTDKAHLWKERAEKWEKLAKEADPAASESKEEPVADPQALFLQAALQKKKATEALQPTGSKWGRIGNFLASRAASEESGEETLDKIQNLEAENAKQADIIKNLRSEMLKMQTSHKEEIYFTKQKVLEIERERDEVALKNVNLAKELELARRLGSLASFGDEVENVNEEEAP